MTPCDAQAEWIAHLARQPGWWQYARAKGRECEADTSGVYRGLVAKVRVLLGDFRPAPGEARPTPDLSLEERIALAAQEKQGLRKPKDEDARGTESTLPLGRKRLLGN